MPNFDELTDADLLVLTEPMEAETDTRDVTCVDCGHVFTVPHKQTTSTRRCPACQAEFVRMGKTPWKGGEISYSRYCRMREGDGVKGGHIGGI